MKNTKLLLGVAAILTIAGCPGNNPPAMDDSGTDAGMVVADTGMRDSGHDSGPTVDMGTDAGVSVDCATYCTTITANCTNANAQYTSMTDCMTQCAAAAFTAGAATDTSGNTLGCRIYHATAAMTLMMPAVHCPHASLLGGGQCSPFRTDPAVEGTGSGHYVRVDRMGMPAVATALIGPGLMPASAVLQAKDDYNDSDPTGDMSFASGVPLLTGLNALHIGLDADLVAHNLTPCSVAHHFPAFGQSVPACAVQQYDAPPGSPGHPVATLVLPDTLRYDPAVATTFPNGRDIDDDVIDPILSVLLLNLSPCAGTPHGEECSTLTAMGMTVCAADTNCAWSGTACLPAATSITAVCAAHTTMATCTAPSCYWTGATCVPTPCEFLPASAACVAVPGCSVSTCGTGTPAPACSVATMGTLGINPHANDATRLATFPYFPMPHP